MIKPLVSVIIPVYNVKDYLSESVRSIMNQEYTDLEILLVDDGSTDGSGEMCDQFSREDARIRVIHQKNQGLSAARNTGIENMTGELVAFLDSDDAFHPQMIRKMVDALLSEKADVSVCRYVECKTKGAMCIPDKEESKETRTIGCSREEILRRFIEEKNWFAWNKVYRKECFENVRYPAGCFYEDMETTLKIFDQANRVVIVDEDLVMYRRWGGSITSSYDVSRIKDRERAYSIVYDYICEHIPEIYTEEHKQSFCRKVLGIQYTVFVRSKSPEDRKIYHEKIRKMEQELDLKKCDSKLKAKYRLYHTSPWLMKITDSTYVRTKKLTGSLRK